MPLIFYLNTVKSDVIILSVKTFEQNKPIEIDAPLQLNLSNFEP